MPRSAATSATSMGRRAARQHALAEPFEQALAVTFGISNLVRAPFVGEQELEQRQLHLVAVAEVFLERAPHQPHGAGDERARRRCHDERPGGRDLFGDAAQDVGVVDAHPGERPAGRFRWQVVAMARGDDREEGGPRRDAPGRLAVELERSPSRERQLEEHHRPGARPEPLHPVPPVAVRVGPRLHVAEVGVARRPPARSLDRRMRRLYEASQVRRPGGRRFWAGPLSGDDVGFQNLERSPPPERGVRARRGRAVRLQHGNPGRVPKPSRDGLRWAKPSSVHAFFTKRP